MSQLYGKEFSGLTDNSRKIIKDCLFVCIKGANFDGHNAAKEALDMGAKMVVTERDLGLGDCQIIVPDTRREYGKLCAEWFGNPQKKLKIIGVTGTNGKTTMTCVIKSILTSIGYKVGLIGTIQNEIGDEILHTDNTTPFAFELMELVAKMVQEGCEYLVMEVSSFGLAQQRIGALTFDAAVFTNLTGDHLDYHGTMENYYQAKKMLFNITEHAIINIDDAYGQRLYQETDCFFKYSYSVKTKADYYAFNIRLNSGGCEFKYNYYDDTFDCYSEAVINAKITGMFNISNLTAVLAVCDCLGLDMLKCFQAIEHYGGTRGRFELIGSKKGFSVICDYAHTPDALENILLSIKGYCKGKIITVFGCGGNRDNRKRPLMGEAASKYSDILIITSDNPRDEDPEKIIEDIIPGVTISYERIHDRREAIFRAVKLARKDDVVLLAGKGHEDYQILKNNEHIHFDEREIVAEALKLI